MGKSKLITKEARRFIIDEIRERGHMSKDEIVELIRPHCSFDPVALQEQAINRLVGSICRSIRDESGVRTVFIAKGASTIVNVESCTSLPLVTAVDEQIRMNMKGLSASRKKTLRRKQELSGQTSFDDIAASG